MYYHKLMGNINSLNSMERDKITKFLVDHPVAVLASVSKDGNPHGSTLYLGVDKNLHISFTTKRDTQKYKNIEHNNHIMLVSYDAKTQTVVQVVGHAIKVTDPEQQEAIYYQTIHAAQITGPDVVPPIARIAAGAFEAFTVDVDDIWISEYSHGDGYKDALEHINEMPSQEDPA